MCCVTPTILWKFLKLVNHIRSLRNSHYIVIIRPYFNTDVRVLGFKYTGKRISFIALPAANIPYIKIRWNCLWQDFLYGIGIRFCPEFTRAGRGESAQELICL